MPTVRNPDQAVRSALGNGSKSHTLEQIAEACETACILVCDITRPVPNHLLIPPIVETLLKTGIERDNICLLIATGLHRPNVGAELSSILGDHPVLDSIRVENHFGRDDQTHVDLGFSARGTPIKLDRRFVEADLKIVTGLVEPHFMAGYSGGRKVVVPGVAHEDTIRTLHNSEFLSDSGCSVCETESNPLHSELLSIVERLRQHCGTNIYSVNVVTDGARQLSYVNFGEIEISHADAMAFCHRFSVVEVDHQFPIVISTGGGYPLDQTFYQAIKGLVTPLDIIEPNGTMILAAECKGGLGSQSFQHAQQRLLQYGITGFLQQTRNKKQADVDEWSTQMLARVQQQARILLYSDQLTSVQFELTGTQRIPSIAQGLHEALRASGKREIAVIPEGPYVVPKLQT